MRALGMKAAATTDDELLAEMRKRGDLVKRALREELDKFRARPLEPRHMECPDHSDGHRYVGGTCSCGAPWR